MKKTFRERPIDVNKPLPIMIGELEDDDMEECDPIEEITHIPVPEIKEKEGRVKDLGETRVEKYEKPFGYIRYFKTYNDEINEILYDMEEDDFDFLKKLNSGTNYQLTEKNFELMISKFEKETKFSSELIDISRIIHLFEFPHKIIKKTYQYWKDKRLKRISKQYPKCGKPLLCEFEIPPDQNDLNPNIAFRPREKPLKKKINEIDSFEKLNQLKKDFENLKSIIECIKEREKLKQELCETHFLLLKSKQTKPESDLLLQDLLNHSKPLFTFLLTLQPKNNIQLRFGRGNRIIQE